MTTKTIYASDLAFAHTTNLSGDERSLQRVRNLIGIYCCAHSAPSAWYGIPIDASISSGVISVDLADGGLWTQGMTKDLILPGRKASEDLQARRDGVITVAALTAIQPAAYFTEDNDKIKDAPLLRSGRPIPPAVEGTSVEQFAEWMITTPGSAAASILEVYWKTTAAPSKGGKKESDGLRGNFGGVINLCRAYADTKQFPVRGTVSILLAGARQYSW